jgi:hypothetical protein
MDRVCPAHPTITRRLYPHLIHANLIPDAAALVAPYRRLLHKTVATYRNPMRNRDSIRSDSPMQPGSFLTGAGRAYAERNRAGRIGQTPCARYSSRTAASPTLGFVAFSS